MSATMTDMMSTAIGSNVTSTESPVLQTPHAPVDVHPYILSARPALNAAALQRALHPHLITARSAWRWPLPAAPSSTQSTPAPSMSDAHCWLARARAAAALADPLCFAFVSRGGAAALARPSAGVRLLTVPTPHSALARRAVSVALFILSPVAPSIPNGAPVRPLCIVAVGYASGAVALFDARTSAFRAISRPVVTELRRLRFHEALHWGSATDSSSDGGLFGVTGSGELCLLPVPQIRALLRAGRAVQPTAQGWTLWSVPSRGYLNDAAPLGAAAASICEVDPRGPDAPLRVVAAGADPALIAYECSRDPIFSARAAAKKAANSVYSFAWGLFSSPDVPDETSPSLVPDIVDAPRVVAAATPGPAWSDHIPADSFSYLPNVRLPNVKGVGQTARKSVTAVLAAPARVFRISSEAAEKSINQDDVPPVGKSMGQQELLDNADPAHGSMDAASLRALLADRGDTMQLKPATNARIAERIAAAPLSCGLLAVADNLGRVLVQDARDMVTVRVLKGYRDAQVAWFGPRKNTCSPLLAVLAPRINILELHTAASKKRLASFRVPHGARLLQTPDFVVFCVAPSGALYELCKTKATAVPFVDVNHTTGSGEIKPAFATNGNLQASTSPAPPIVPLPPDEETVAAFVEAARAQNVVRATDILQTFVGEPAKVAYLLARLLGSGYAPDRITPDVHVALAACAANLASAERSPDLEMRYFSHGRLAESYGLITLDRGRTGNTGYTRKLRMLRDDALGAGLADSAAVERAKVGTLAEKRRLSVEEFVLAHSIVPSADVEAKNTVSLPPRLDLTENEKEVVAHTYFSGLLDVPVEKEDFGSSEDATGASDVLMALRDLHALPIAEIASIFVTFFLTAPIDSLLSTPVALHSSALRCMLARLRSAGNRKLVDEVILSACETTTRHAVNAVLLVRLCVVGEDGAPEGDMERDAGSSLGRLLHVLQLLDEVLLLRRLVADTSLAADVMLNTAAQHCAGARGTAERRAVAIMLGKSEYAAAANVLEVLLEFRKPPLEWHELSLVSEEAIQICRRRTAALLDGDLFSIILPAVGDWIHAAGAEQDFKSDGNDMQHFLGIRTVMLAAHAHVPDASVDAVRCLQLAEAMTAVMMARGNGRSSETKDSAEVEANCVAAPLVESSGDTATVEQRETMDICSQDCKETREDGMTASHNLEAVLNE